jgi:hypothetical protein
MVEFLRLAGSARPSSMLLGFGGERWCGLLLFWCLGVFDGGNGGSGVSTKIFGDFEGAAVLLLIFLGLSRRRLYPLNSRGGVSIRKVFTKY